MLSPGTTGDSLHVTNYVEDYLDLVESLPFDLQRNVSLMREIDAKYQGKLHFFLPDLIIVALFRLTFRFKKTSRFVQ